MLTITDLWLDGYVNFKKAHISLNKHPLVVVRGKNLDRTGTGSANAVGKSTLFSAIPALRYGAPPESVKKKSAGGLLNKKGSVKLRFTEGPHTYDVVQKAKGKTYEYLIEQDGTDQGIRKVPDSVKYLERVFPVTEEQFYAVNYINPRNFHVLLRGKSDQRFDFYENLFGLGVYDKIYASVSKTYNQMKAQRQNLEFLHSERQAIPDYKNLVPMQRNLVVLEANMHKVQRRIASYREEQQHISAFLSVAEGVDLVSDVAALKASLTKKKSIKLKLQDSYDKILAQWQDYTNYQRAKVAIEETRAEIAKLGDTGDLNLVKIEALVEESHDQVIRLENLLKQREQQAKQTLAIVNQIEKLKLPPKWVAKSADYTAQQLRTLTDKTRQKLDHNKELLADLPDTKMAVCPTCHQKIDSARTNKLRAQIALDIGALELKTVNYRKVAQYLELSEQILGVKQPTVSVEKLREKLDKHEKEWYNYKQQRYNIQQKSKLGTRLKDLLASNKETTKPLETKEGVQQRITEIDLEIVSLRHNIQQRARLEVMKGYESIEEAQILHKKYNRFIDKYQPRLDKALASLQALNISITNAKNAKDKLASITAKMEAIDKATEDFSIYEALRSAYGAKGLRILQIENLAKMYCARLNKYAHLIFPEPITFETVVEASRFDILATRNGKPSDVRSLSGSESTSFVLLSLIALLPYIPANKRLNLLIIDEIETGMDEVVLSKILNEFIPELNRIIPNVVLITPQSREVFNVPGAFELTIVKKNGISSIMKD